MVTGLELAAARTLWHFHRIDHKLAYSDVIIGLGSYDFRVAERCAEIFLAGLGPRIIFTGLSGNWTSGRLEASEAACFATRARQKGVPSSSIVLEEQATNIGENIRFSAAMMDNPACTVILVTKPQTQRRCHATVKKQWPEARALVTAPQHAFEEQPCADFPIDFLIHEMVGDFYRILTYPGQSFQIEQHIPDNAMSAFRYLVENGYHNHLPPNRDEWKLS